MNKLILVAMLLSVDANAGIVEDLTKVLKEEGIELGVVNGSGCEAQESVSGAFFGCFGNKVDRLAVIEKTLHGKGYKVTRQGKALVVVK